MNGDDMINEGAPDFDVDEIVETGEWQLDPDCAKRDENGWPLSTTCEGCIYEREAVHEYLEKHPEDSDKNFEELFGLSIQALE